MVTRVEALMLFVNIYFMSVTNNFDKPLLINSCHVLRWCYYCDEVVWWKFDVIPLYGYVYSIKHLSGCLYQG